MPLNMDIPPVFHANSAVHCMDLNEDNHVLAIKVQDAISFGACVVCHIGGFQSEYPNWNRDNGFARSFRKFYKNLSRNNLMKTTEDFEPYVLQKNGKCPMDMIGHNRVPMNFYSAFRYHEC
jgi:hypothetical protein